MCEFNFLGFAFTRIYINTGNIASAAEFLFSSVGDGGTGANWLSTGLFTSSDGFRVDVHCFNVSIVKV